VGAVHFGRRTQAADPFHFWTIFNFDWLADGKWLVMTRAASARDVVLLNLK
jgi:hypothetical protein